MKKKLFIVFVFAYCVLLNLQYTNGMSYIKDAWNGAISATKKGWRWIRGEDTENITRNENNLKKISIQENQNSDQNNGLQAINAQSKNEQKTNQDLIQKSKIPNSAPKIAKKIIFKLKKDIIKKEKLEKEGNAETNEELKKIKETIKKDIKSLKKIHNAIKKNNPFMGGERDSFYNFIKSSFQNKKNSKAHRFKKINNNFKNKKKTIQSSNFESNSIFDSQKPYFEPGAVKNDIKFDNNNDDDNNIDKIRVNALILPHIKKTKKNQKNLKRKIPENIKAITSKLKNKLDHNKLIKRGIDPSQKTNDNIDTIFKKSTPKKTELKRIAHLILPQKI